MKRISKTNAMEQLQKNPGVDKVNLLGMIKAQKRYIQELENMLMV